MLHSVEQGDGLAGWDSGKALEYIVLRQFDIEGASVTWPFQVKLDEQVVEQIDGAVYFEGLACLVECKDYGDAINIEPLAKLRSQLLRRPSGTLATVFARNGYTQPAKVLARYIVPLSILLWEFSELKYALKRQALCAGLLSKYRRAVELGIPDYNIMQEDL